MAYRPESTVAALTDISTLGGPVITDKALVDRAGTAYNATQTELIALYRKTAAGSRSASLPAVLSASDNDKLVILTGTTGNLSVDGTVTDGFSCVVLNTASGAATLVGITDPTGATTVATNTSRRIMMGGAAVYALAPFSSGGSATAATSYTFTQSGTTGNTGVADHLTLHAVGGSWKPGSITLTPSGGTPSYSNIVGGTISGNVVTPAFGSGDVTLDITPTAAGAMSITPTNTMGLPNPSVLNYTVTSAGGGSHPNLTMTSPTYNTGKFGQALTGGTGASSAITITDTSGCSVGFWFKMTSGANNYSTVLQIVGLGSFGIAYSGAEFSTSGSAAEALSNTNAPTTAGGVPNINDGNWHWIYVDRRDPIDRSGGAYGSFYVDGAAVTTSMLYSNPTNSLTVNVGPANFPGGAIDDLVIWNGADASRAAVPTAAQGRVTATNVIWAFDGSGTGT